MSRFNFLTAFALSLVVHQLLFAATRNSSPPRSQLHTGRQAVRLTLRPSAPVPAPMSETAPAAVTIPEATREHADPRSIETAPAAIVGNAPLTAGSESVTPEPSEPPEAPDRQTSDPTSTSNPPPPREIRVAEEPVQKEAAGAPEQNAALDQQGIATPAMVTRGYRPEYPLISRRRGEEGSVIIKFEIFADGTPGHQRVVASSGYPRLDQAALSTLKKTTFAPATEYGRPVRSVSEWTFTFRLEDRP